MKRVYIFLTFVLFLTGCNPVKTISPASGSLENRIINIKPKKNKAIIYYLPTYFMIDKDDKVTDFNNPPLSRYKLPMGLSLIVSIDGIPEGKLTVNDEVIDDKIVNSQCMVFEYDLGEANFQIPFIADITMNLQGRKKYFVFYVYDEKNNKHLWYVKDFKTFLKMKNQYDFPMADNRCNRCISIFNKENSPNY